MPIFYMTSIAVSVTSLFGLWHLGVKPLLLDNFRDALFSQRDRLYALGNAGKLEYNSAAYRAVELFLNNLIRYAHRFSFFSIVSSIANREKLRASAAGETRSEMLNRTIQSVPDPLVRSELDSIIRVVTLQLMPQYIAKSSMFFIFCTAVYLILSKSYPAVEKGRAMVVGTFEAEAYRHNDFGFMAAVAR